MRIEFTHRDNVNAAMPNVILALTTATMSPSISARKTLSKPIAGPTRASLKMAAKKHCCISCHVLYAPSM